MTGSFMPEIRFDRVAKGIPLLAGLLISTFVSLITLLIAALGGFIAILFFGGFIFELLGFAAYRFDVAESRQVLLLGGVASLATCAVSAGLTLAAGRVSDWIISKWEKQVTETEAIWVTLALFGLLLAYAGYHFFVGPPLTADELRLIRAAAPF